MVDDAEPAGGRRPLRAPSAIRPRRQRPWAMAIGTDATTTPVLRRLVLERGMGWEACDRLEALPAAERSLPSEERPDLVFLLDAAALETLESVRKDLQDVVLVLDGDRCPDREVILHANVTVLCRPLDRRFLARWLDEVVEEWRRAARCFGPGAGAASLDQFGGLQGNSAVMRRLFTHMARIAGSTGSVLIYGERGTGKARAAAALHAASRSAAGPFVVIEGRDGLAFRAEAELAAGAASPRRSLLPERIEAARGGTLFINHVNDLPTQTQIPLLRALEKPPFGRVPGPGAVRVVAAVDRDPLAAIRDGHLREDLYECLARYVLRLPPLRERRHDVVALARLFLRQRNQASGTCRTLSPEAVVALCRHSWPGNVGELKNVIEHAHARAGPRIGVEDLPSAVGGGDAFPDGEAGQFRDIV